MSKTESKLHMKRNQLCLGRWKNRLGMGKAGSRFQENLERYRNVVAIAVMTSFGHQQPYTKAPLDPHVPSSTPESFLI
jgi:hypothetical protein